MDTNQKASDLYEDLRAIPALEPIGTALARFAESLSPNGQFKLTGERWVYQPDNFVAFKVQSKRARSIVLTLYGNTLMLKRASDGAGLHQEWLELEPDRASYSRYTITSPKQLLAAAFFIRLASQYHPRRRRKAVEV